MAQITSVTSEALQAKIRTLLPSQQGFGEDLQASNVILPVIDLTTTAEGASVPIQLQEALGFNDITVTTTNGAAGSDTIINTAGFYLIEYFIVCGNNVAAPLVTMSDGLSNKNLIQIDTASTGPIFAEGRLTVFLTSGDSVTQTTNNADANIHTIVRQIADVNGVLKNPTGFTPQ